MTTPGQPSGSGGDYLSKDNQPGPGSPQGPDQGFPPPPPGYGPPPGQGFPPPPGYGPPPGGDFPPPPAGYGPPPGPGFPPPPPGYGPPPGPGFPPPGFGPGPDPAAPYGRHPITGEPYSDKQKLTAGLLQLLLGGFGAGRWYLGDTGIAVAQLLTCGGLGIWALIDGVMILTGNVRDKYGRPLRD